jgi:SpoVK/Ycf46/Vps4 family AAA+-type ATPase
LRQIFKQGRLAAPSIIFLDEIDALFANRDSADSESTGTQLLSVLLTEMDGLELATGALTCCTCLSPPSAMPSPPGLQLMRLPPTMLMSLASWCTCT